MIRFIIKLVIIGGLSFVGQLYFPWWIIMAVPFVINIIIKTKGISAFFSSFLAVSILWFVLTWTIHQNTDGLLSKKMAEILPLQGNAIILIFITAFLGGLASGFAGLTGNAFRNVIKNPKNKKERHSRYGRPDYMYR